MRRRRHDVCLNNTPQTSLFFVLYVCADDNLNFGFLSHQQCTFDSLDIRSTRVVLQRAHRGGSERSNICSGTECLHNLAEPCRGGGKEICAPGGNFKREPKSSGTSLKINFWSGTVYLFI